MAAYSREHGNRNHGKYPDDGRIATSKKHDVARNCSWVTSRGAFEAA